MSRQQKKDSLAGGLAILAAVLIWVLLEKTMFDARLQAEAKRKRK